MTIILWESLDVRLYQLTDAQDLKFLPDTAKECISMGIIEYTDMICSDWKLSLIIFSDFGEGCYLLYPSTLDLADYQAPQEMAISH